VIAFSIASNSTNLQITTNVFFFVGLFLDVLGGCIAYLGVVELQKIHALLLRLTSEVSSIGDALEKHKAQVHAAGPTSPYQQDPLHMQRLAEALQYLQFSEAIALHLLGDLRAWNENLAHLKAGTRSLEMVVSAVLSDSDMDTQVHVPDHLQNYIAATGDLVHAKMTVSLAFSARKAAPMTTFCGILCFIIGLLCFVKASQPMGVWVASFTVVVDIHSTCK
jgi:hypothetical protein